MLGQAGGTVHMGGTFIVIEGPRFSTRGESNIYRSWGIDIIGMTAVPEAQLAREAEICYATMAHVTDYDVWYEGEEDVTLEQVLANEATERGISVGDERVRDEILRMLPYVVTLVALSGIVGRARPPAALGEPLAR